MAEQEGQGPEGQKDEQDPIQRFESLVAKYGNAEPLKMFKHFHSPGFTVKHPPEVTNNIEYVLDGNKVKVRCKCGAALDLTDYSKLDKV